jgi:phosphomannomutase/phosphoglucomutase
MNAQIFREYDIRGIADSDLTDGVVSRIGRAVGSHYRRHGASRIAIGRDVRLSSERIRNAFAGGLTRTGLHVVDVGELPTPLLYHAAAVRGLDGGAMITGSHNPIEYNGIKLVRGGLPVYGAEIEAIGRLASGSEFESGAGETVEADAYADYRREVEPLLTPQRALHVVVDCGNGAASLLAVDLLSALGHRVDALYCEPDGRFPNHLPDPTVPELMVDLVNRVRETGAEIGLGFDGDGDRVGAVDARGRMVFGDQILAILARDLLERRPGASVLFDVKCSQALAEDIAAHGGRPVMGPTGHSLIKARMKADGIPLAGEMSGHMFLGEDYRGYDDAFFAAGRLMQALGRWDTPLDVLVDSLPRYESTPEIRVECPDERKWEVVAEVGRRFKRDHDVIEVDGARVQFGDGWGLIRASNTQPVLVLRFEARSRERLEEIREQFAHALKAFPEVKLPRSPA